ncbi:MAG: dienelactone hydrolase [Hellea sp.]|nr:dienelactone hydrolase [Hellea sp.]
MSLRPTAKCSVILRALIRPKSIRVIAKYLAFAAAALALSGCKQGVDAWNEAPVDHNKAKYEKLPLPAFPDYPAPQMQLSAGDSGVIYFSTKSPYDFSRVLHGYDTAPDTTGKGTLVLPDGASPDSPVPAMVILHGSGGIADGREFTYAELFADNGIASFVVDYYAPRGVTEETPYVMKTMATTEVDIIADAYSALKIIGTHPAIDASRIGVTGYSYGGMATRYALDIRIKEIMAPDIPPFALHMDLYGPCHQDTGSWRTTGAPYLAIYGDADNSVDPETCSDVQDFLGVGGSEVESHIIAGAGHAWENSAPKGKFGQAYIRGCEFSWHPETGIFMVNGKSGEFQPEPDMTREERAFVRSKLGSLAGGCIGMGYTAGNDPAADAESKAWQLDFMKRHFNLSITDKQ